MPIVIPRRSLSVRASVASSSLTCTPVGLSRTRAKGSPRSQQGTAAGRPRQGVTALGAFANFPPVRGNCVASARLLPSSSHSLMRLLTFALVASLAPMVAVAQGAAQGAAKAAAGPITGTEIDGDLRFLSSDLLEGRAPATRADKITTEYLADQLRSAGVEPGVNGSYFQTVPIDVVKADPASIKVNATGKSTMTLRSPDDVVVFAGSAVETSNASGELVYVGYGASAPEYKWDDYKGMDLKGKIL